MPKRAIVMFDTKYPRHLHRLPSIEKAWLAIVAITMTATLALGIAALPARSRVNHMSLAADAVGDKTRTLALGSSHVYRGINPELTTARHMNLAADAFDYICMSAVLEGALHRAPNVKAVIIEADPLLYQLDSINYYWGDYRILFDLRCDINALDTNIKRKTALWYEWFWYRSVLGALMGDDKLTPTHLYERRRQPKLGPPQAGYLPTVGHISAETDGAERVRLQIRDLGRVNQAQMRKNIHRFEQMVDGLLARGYRVSIMTLPHHQTYRDNRPTEWVDLHQDVMARLEGRFSDRGMEVWDFHDDTRFDNSDFYDGDHLNASGATKFTKILDGQLSRLLTKSPDGPGSGSTN